MAGGYVALIGADVTIVSDPALRQVIGNVIDNAIEVSPGTVTLTGAQTYQGGTTINAGSLSVANDGNLGDSGQVGYSLYGSRDRYEGQGNSNWLAA